MSRSPMIPPQPQRGTPAETFDAFARRLLAVPKSQIDAQEKRESPKHKKTK